MSRSLTKAGIVEARYSQNPDLNRSTAKDIVEAMIALMKQVIADDSALLLKGIGKFGAYAKKGRPHRDARLSPFDMRGYGGCKGRNSHTVERVDASPTCTPSFKDGRNQNHVVDEGTTGVVLHLAKLIAPRRVSPDPCASAQAGGPHHDSQGI